MEERLRAVSEALAPATQTAGLLPDGTDLDFHTSIDPGLKRALDDVTDELCAVLRRLAAWAEPGSAPADRAAVDDMLNAKRFTSTVEETVDRLLEQTDLYLDEYAGRRPFTAPDAAKEVKSVASYEAAGPGKLPRHWIHASIPRPQDKFTRKPDNAAHRPWRPSLKYGKPHARVPLGFRKPEWTMSEDALIEGQYGVEGDARLNPYHVEIYETPIPAHALAVPTPEAPKPLDMHAPSSSTPCPFVWVDTEAKVRALQAHLNEPRVTEIAVDLEHHSHRTYAGLVSLMQISTRWGDWIVDTLVDEVREHIELLNTAFTHPDKVLVLHGADHDILWLQRDLGLYVTNLFDTYQASKVLQFGALSLAYLLLRYVDFEADKRFQVADWRLRPLPREMLFYARSDTHFLLYVYDRLRVELHERGGAHCVAEVFANSRATASKMYAKPPWDAQGDSRTGWRSVWLKWGGDLARASQDAPPEAPLSREMRLVRRVHQWRDQVAREEDESPHYVATPQVVVNLALRPPTNVAEAQARVPKPLHLVRERLAELVQVIGEELQLYDKEARARADASTAAWDVASAEDLGESLGAEARADTQVDAPPAALPAALQRGSWGETAAAPLQPQVWAAPAPAPATDGAQLFRGMRSHTVQEHSAPKAPAKKRKSLFEAPAAGGAPPAESVLARIRAECVQWLGGLFGADMQRHGTQAAAPDTKAAVPPAAKSSHGAPARDELWHTQPSETPSDDDHVAKRAAASAAAAAAAAAADDEAEEAERIVQVTKRGAARGATVLSDGTAARRAPRRAAAPAPAPFDYEQATSVLDTPSESSGHSLLKATSDRRTAVREPSTKRAKRQSDMRSGNRSKTFARKM